MFAFTTDMCIEKNGFNNGGIEFSTPQKLTNSKKFMDELADQEFEIQTFKVENGQSHSKTRGPHPKIKKLNNNKSNDQSQERSSDNSSRGMSNFKQSVNSSSSSKQSNQQSDQQKSQDGLSNFGNFSAT